MNTKPLRSGRSHNVDTLAPFEDWCLNLLRFGEMLDCSRRFRYVALVLGTCVSLMELAACSLTDLVTVDNPTDLITLEQVTTSTGAMGLYGGTIAAFNTVYRDKSGDVVWSGILSDEFQDSSYRTSVDARTSSFVDPRDVYKPLQFIRTQGLEAVAAMRQFPEEIPSPLVGRVYAMVGYAELLLAERFCSGVPLARIPAGGGAITYTPGLTTAQLFDRAVAHFDTALSLTGTDSVRFRQFAQVGKGRALMGLGRYSDARAAVAEVPTEFVYLVESSAADTNGIRPQTGSSLFTSDVGEGINGIDWLAAQDPRVPIKDTVRGRVRSSKYPTATSPIVVADGIEARLIEAEADLDAGNPTWLTTVNQLRARLVTSTGTRLLADTTDPGTDEARVDLVFYERAFWLYATGHRHGDLRRLVRQYKRSAHTVFPIGVYDGVNSWRAYGDVVVLEVPDQGNTNPYVNGCLDTNA